MPLIPRRAQHTPPETVMFGFLVVLSTLRSSARSRAALLSEVAAFEHV